jgi:hypothetical protein
MNESSRVPEARLEDNGSGLAPVDDGWFVVNVRDAQWLTSEGGEKQASGSECPCRSSAGAIQVAPEDEPVSVRPASRIRAGHYDAVRRYVISDEIHCEWLGEFESAGEAWTEVLRLASDPELPENRALAKAGVRAPATMTCSSMRTRPRQGG